MADQSSASCSLAIIGYGGAARTHAGFSVVSNTINFLGTSAQAGSTSKARSDDIARAKGEVKPE